MPIFIPIVIAAVVAACSTRNGIDEDPIMADSGKGGKDEGVGLKPDTADGSSYSDAPHVDLPNAADGHTPDVITADLFAQDSGDVYGPDHFIEPDGVIEPEVAEDTQIAQPDITPDVSTDVPVTSKFCEPKVTLPANCGITEVAAGANVSCLIKSGTVYCAGKIVSSVDPNASLFNSTSFVAIPSLAGAKHIAIGGAHICAIMPGNDVKCLGQNIWGQLGDSTKQDAKMAVSASNLGNVAAISLGQFHTLALDASGKKISAWGFNKSGQLGIASAPLTATTPQSISLPANTVSTSICAGGLHSVAIASDGTAYAWGNNTLFPLGVGATGNVLTPTPLQNSKLGLRIAAGDDFTLLLDQNCTASSVGNGGLGQLGLGTSSNATMLTPIPSLSGIAAVVAGGQHACAVTMDGALFCWGENSFGNPIKIPTQVTGISSVVQTSLGTNHGIALIASCQVFAWGKNTVGQLGLGNTTDVPSPTAISIN